MTTIALAGKGGSGKTTIAGLIISCLLNMGKKPLLAVDADPDSNLDEILGVKSNRTVVSTVDEIMEKKEELPAGMTKDRLLEFHLQDAIVESIGFDLLVMGRTEGVGCYCRANDLLRGFMEKLRENYEFVVMDNEAGLEHLSRRTTRDVDMLLIVTNPTVVSLKSADRIYQAAQKLKLNIKKSFILINEIGDSRFQKIAVAELALQRKKKSCLVDVLGNVPYDGELLRASINGSSIFDLPDTSTAKKAVEKLLKDLEI